MQGFSIIVAVDEKMGIGKGNALPWRISRDMQHFKEITIAPSGRPQNVLIMGRKTWESLPSKFRPLPGRVNVVITSQTGYDLPREVSRFPNLDAALGCFCSKTDEHGQVFVIGGAQVFAQAIKHPLCSKLFITHIVKDYSCDVFFPDIPFSYKMINKTPVLSENDVNFFFSTYGSSS